MSQRHLLPSNKKVNWKIKIYGVWFKRWANLKVASEGEGRSYIVGNIYVKIFRGNACGYWGVRLSPFQVIMDEALCCR